MSSSANSAASLVDAQINSAVAKGDSDIDELVSTYRLVDTTAENSDKAYTEIQSLMTTCKIDLLTCGLSKHSCRGTVACIVTAAAVKTDFERLAGWLAGARRGGGGRATGWLGHSADPARLAGDGAAVSHAADRGRVEQQQHRLHQQHCRSACGCGGK